METNSDLMQLLKCLIHLIGRVAVPAEKVIEIVGKGKRQISAFNLSDGSNIQSEIARKSGVNQGNLSRAFKKWVEAGVAFSLGEGKDARLLHIYPIPRNIAKMANRSRKSTKKGRRDVS